MKSGMLLHNDDEKDPCCNDMVPLHHCCNNQWKEEGKGQLGTELKAEGRGF